MLDLSLNNHESNVVCVIPSFLIALKSSFKAGFFFFFLPPSWFLFFRLGLLNLGGWELDSFPFSQTLGPMPQNERYPDLFFFVFAPDVFA